ETAPGQALAQESEARTEGPAPPPWKYRPPRPVQGRDSQERCKVLGKSREADFVRIAKRPGVAVSPAVKRQETNTVRRLKQAERLAHVAAQAVLKHEGHAIADIEKMESQAIVLEEGHGANSPFAGERSANTWESLRHFLNIKWLRSPRDSR